MSKPPAWAHLLETFHWSSNERIGVAEVLAAAFGMAGPVMVGMLAGHPSSGFAAAIGSLAVGRVAIGCNGLARLRREVAALAPPVIAALLMVIARRHNGLTDLIVILSTVFAAVIGGFSRPMAVATTRFILFLMILNAAPALTANQEAGFLILVLLGALWTAALGFAFGAIARHDGKSLPIEPPQKPATTSQNFARWKRSLGTGAGWSFPIRLGSCLALAALMDRVSPGHHLHWISLTLAILTPRRGELFPVKTTQRALGTAIGVALAGIVLSVGLPAWGIVIAVAFLAGARRLLRTRNYLAYSAVMTPLIVLIIDAGHAPETGLLLDRLAATLIAAVLVMTASWLLGRLQPLPPTQATQHPPLS